jgi:hypothetical protein
LTICSFDYTINKKRGQKRTANMVEYFLNNGVIVASVGEVTAGGLGVAGARIASAGKSGSKGVMID